ncbi:hypothetical protein ACAF76_010065 [Brevibacillus sp. TJ4]|uniref:hypothetical protein n=1 Tax=Brevibacillus sp. TJ4 TaxID=3234853 RepID=UPI003BA39F69
MKTRRFLSVLFLLSCIVTVMLAIPGHAVTDPARVQIDSTSAASLRGLIQRSDAIAIGTIGSQIRSYPTGRTIREGKIVNYTQSFHIRTLIKGRIGSSVTLISTGIDPLPGRESPLNQTYPGPLTGGDYLLFLQNVKGTDFYSITGLWQGVYPIVEGRTVTLEVGFRELHHLSPRQAEQKLRDIR